jgi:hypothetical protein
MENRHCGDLVRYYQSCMSVLTCKLRAWLDGHLAKLAKRLGVPKSVLVDDAIAAKITETAAAPHRQPSNLIDALGDSVASVASGKSDRVLNKTPRSNARISGSVQNLC